LHLDPIGSIIVVGASAGGLEPLRQLLRDLEAKLPAAVFIVRHIGPRATSTLPDILGREGSLALEHAAHGKPIQPRRAYVAPPDRHLTFRNGCMETLFGPRVNFARPSIDVTFRSAARAYGRRVIGVVLSGGLDDGTAGLLAIKRAGGVAIVQDPFEAQEASMPLTAARYLNPDYVLKAAEIGSVLNSLAFRAMSQHISSADVVSGSPSPESAVERQSPKETTQRIQDDLAKQERGERRGRTATFSCPECGGVLWEADEEGPRQFQCHVGHRYTGEHLVRAKSEDVEKAVWQVMRTLKEVMLLSTELAAEAKAQGNAAASVTFDRQARRAEAQLHQLEQQLMHPPQG
jgi:two-component system chemotaxis response regulator CheB